MNEKISFSELYENMQAILARPELYSVEITQFLAGGLGACVYRQSITIAELVRCWQHKEYQIQCPNCGETAYITQWAGHANGGGYWEINAYCPHCGKKHHLPRESSVATHHIIHWTKMRDVLQEERSAMKEMEKNDQGDSLTQQLTLLKRRIRDVNNRFYNFGVTSLSHIVPKTYRRYLFPKDVIGFLNEEFEWRVVSMMSSPPTFTNIF